MHSLAEMGCNGTITDEQWEKASASALKSLDNLLHYKEQNIPVFINGDPRGYALKIENEYIASHAIDIHRDWGGYGIICPEF